MASFNQLVPATAGLHIGKHIVKLNLQFVLQVDVVLQKILEYMFKRILHMTTNGISFRYAPCIVRMAISCGSRTKQYLSEQKNSRHAEDNCLPHPSRQKPRPEFAFITINDI